jgi:hypothetical protein
MAQQRRNATPYGETAKHLICDNDSKFGPAFEAAATLRACGLEVIHTPYEAPRANAICERFAGSVRRECLDPLLVLGHRRLVRALVEYAGYFNPSRPHQGLAQQTPDSCPLGQATAATVQSIARPVAPTAPVELSRRKLLTVLVLNGLHHAYTWVTWGGCPQPVHTGHKCHRMKSVASTRGVRLLPGRPAVLHPVFQTRLIPRWLSGWGIVGIVAMLVACVLAVFSDSPVTGYALLAAPIGLQEMVLAVWLIVKRFNALAAPATVAGRAAQELLGAA